MTCRPLNVRIFSQSETSVSDLILRLACGLNGLDIAASRTEAAADGRSPDGRRDAPIAASTTPHAPTATGETLSQTWVAGASNRLEQFRRRCASPPAKRAHWPAGKGSGTPCAHARTGMPPKLQYTGSASWAAPTAVTPPARLQLDTSLPSAQKPMLVSSGGNYSPDGSPRSGHSGRSGRSNSPRSPHPTTPRGKLEQVARMFGGCCFREAPHAANEYSVLSRESEWDGDAGAPEAAEVDPWAERPYSQPPPLRQLTTRRVFCCTYTTGPSASELRGRQRWLRAEIDEKEAALSVVRDDMRSLLCEADEMAIRILELKEKVANANSDRDQAEPRLVALEAALESAKAEMDETDKEVGEWHEEVSRMHDANRATAKKGHAAVMKLDTNSTELQESELTLTMQVAESDERLGGLEEQIRKLKTTQDALVDLMQQGPLEDLMHVKLAVSAFMSVCHDGNRPLHSEQFQQMCRALQLTEDEIEAIKHERRKRRSRLGGSKSGSKNTSNLPPIMILTKLLVLSVLGMGGMLKRQLSSGSNASMNTSNASLNTSSGPDVSVNMSGGVA